MAEIKTAGYQDIRDYIQANWLYIEVRDASVAGTGGAAVVRLPVSDARVDWIHAANAQALQLRVVLTGSDADITEPVTLRSTAIYKVATGGSAFSEEVLAEGDATINAAADSVTITHTIEVPDIP